MAKAVQVFKESLIEGERLRVEQEQSKQQAEAERRKSMLSLADRFESSVGGIVKEVGNSASELNGTARAMSRTADQATQESATVPTASDQTSHNVQTVASAT